MVLSNTDDRKNCPQEVFLKNLTASELVAKALRQNILSGAIPDGAELTQEMIASQLGVSRMPIREALYTLEFEGYIERLGNRRIRVIGIGSGMLMSRLYMYSLIESALALKLSELDSRTSTALALSETIQNKESIENELLFHSTLFFATNDSFYNQMYQVIIKPTLIEILENTIHGVTERISVLQQLVTSIEKQESSCIQGHIEYYYKTFILSRKNL